jgi:hypothetical protein
LLGRQWDCWIRGEREGGLQNLSASSGDPTVCLVGDHVIVPHPLLPGWQVFCDVTGAPDAQAQVGAWGVGGWGSRTHGQPAGAPSDHPGLAWVCDGTDGTTDMSQAPPVVMSCRCSWVWGPPLPPPSIRCWPPTMHPHVAQSAPRQSSSCCRWVPGE